MFVPAIIWFTPPFKANDDVTALDDDIAWEALCAQLEVIAYVAIGKKEAVNAWEALCAQEDVVDNIFDVALNVNASESTRDALLPVVPSANIT